MSDWGRRQFDIEDSFSGWRFWLKVLLVVALAATAMGLVR